METRTKFLEHTHRLAAMPMCPFDARRGGLYSVEVFDLVRVLCDCVFSPVMLSEWRGFFFVCVYVSRLLSSVASVIWWVFILATATYPCQVMSCRHAVSRGPFLGPFLR